MADEFAGKWVTLLGTGSIQQYVFRTNRLKENSGASDLVRRALTDWEKSEYKIFVGGGNAALLFPDDTTLRREIREWSRRWLEAAPNLRLLAAHRQVKGSLREAYSEAQTLLRRHEDAPPFGAELGQLPVVRECASTGRAANGREADRTASLSKDSLSKAWLSKESLQKQDASHEAHRYLAGRYDDALGGHFRFPKEFSDLGTKEGASQIALVHADGNRIGSLFQDLVRDSSLDGAAFLERLRALSKAVSRLAFEAFAETVRELRDSPSHLREQDVHYDQGDEGRDKAPFLQMRPIVEAGDDLTFVCHGRLGLSLAVRYLRNFERLSGTILEGQVTDGSGPRRSACAGVLIMPEKFPFARAYGIAAALTHQAKAEREAKKDGGSWLAFHAVLEGASNDEPPGKTYSLASGQERPESWARFKRLWNLFQQWPRSRAKGLFEALSRGSADLELASIRARGIPLPEAGITQAEYLAPLEMLDFHIQWPEMERP